MSTVNYDSIVIGAGHNGLVCATYLARAGHSVLLLEASEQVGGMAAQREFHPGFHAAVPHQIGHFSPRVARDLGLQRHGFRLSRQPSKTTALAADGKHRVLAGDSLRGVPDVDVAAYGEYSRMLGRFAHALEPFWHRTMPRLGNNNAAELLTFAHLGFNIRRLGRHDMREFLRIAALPTRDLMDEFFEDHLLKVLLSWDGLIGAKMAPRSPNSAVLTMLYRMAGKPGGPGLVPALRAAAEAAGVEIRTGAPVARIQVEGGTDGLAATGVELETGDTVRADRVLSSTDPKTTFLDLVGAEHLEIGFTQRIRRLRCDGYVAKLHLALNGLPQFTGIERPEGRMILASDLDAIEFAYDDAKYGDTSASPVIEIAIPTLEDPSLAPEGRHVLSANVMYAPYRLKGGWTDDARDAMTERVIDAIETCAPGLRNLIAEREFLSPADLEEVFHVTGGHWHHTEVAADQLLMMRPTYEAAQYTTPIQALYLCGAGTHPGGDLTGAPGRNAAREVLR